MKKILPFFLALFLLLTFHVSFLSAQQQLGLRIENYSGINATSLNPAARALSPLAWDVNLVSGGIFIENDYAFIANSNLIHFLSHADNEDNFISAINKDPSELPISSSSLVYDFYDNTSSKFYQLFTDISGPSVGIRLASGHAFGLSTRLRVGASSSKIPFELGFYHLDRTPFEEHIDIDAVHTAGMAWNEVALNYSYAFESNTGSISIGVTAKYLMGYEAFYVEAPNLFTISQLPDDTIQVVDAIVNYGFTSSNSDADQDFSLTQNGAGIGFDMGAIMTIDGEHQPYAWKLGASITDIGKVNFNTNAQVHQLTQDESMEIDNIPFGSFSGNNSLEEYAQELSFYVLDDEEASLKSNSFGIGLPAALSLQADYQVFPRLFIHTVLVQRIKLNATTLGRPNMVALSPRYESRWLAASFPLILHEYKDLRLGFSARLAFFTIGSDNLASIFSKKDFTGGDLYFGIKINPFSLSLGGSRKKGKAVRCYEF